MAERYIEADQPRRFAVGASRLAGLLLVLLASYGAWAAMELTREGAAIFLRGRGHLSLDDSPGFDVPLSDSQLYSVFGFGTIAVWAVACSLVAAMQTVHTKLPVAHGALVVLLALGLSGLVGLTSIFAVWHVGSHVSDVVVLSACFLSACLWLIMRCFTRRRRTRKERFLLDVGASLAVSAVVFIGQAVLT